MNAVSNVSNDVESLAQTIVAEVKERGAADDPGATIAVLDLHHATTVQGLEHEIARLRELLKLPESVLTVDDPNAGIDDVLADLYGRSILDREQFLLAHTSLDVDLSEEEDSNAARYRKLGFFDAGGAGEIFVAKDKRLRRKVAVKKLKPSQAKSAESLDKFRREAQITAQLDHPNIIPIYSLEKAEGEDEPLAYAMKLIRGSTLSSALEQERKRVEEGKADTDHDLASRLELLLKVCDAIDYAHSRRVVHRDLKPQNIMIGGFGEVYVMDWGLARVIGTSEELGGLAGTPLYMSPEQAKSLPESISPASDIYALGLIFFELCTLRAAIPGNNLLYVMCNAIEGKKEPFEHLKGKALSPDLEAIFTRATQFEPAARYPTAKALGDDIRHYLRGEELWARPDNLTRKLQRAMVRHRQLTLMLVLLLMLISAGAVIWSMHSEQATLEAAKLREERIMAWQSQVAWHASDLDRQFLRVALLTQGLSRTVRTLLQ
ncbi:MAG: serine/threonine-protein kinase, partial [Myxococcota bacterium]|nr:serine/threonine-protein kinase [Myxococcota bacterium]